MAPLAAVADVHPVRAFFKLAIQRFPDGKSAKCCEHKVSSAGAKYHMIFTNREDKKGKKHTGLMENLRKQISTFVTEYYEESSFAYDEKAIDEIMNNGCSYSVWAVDKQNIWSVLGTVLFAATNKGAIITHLVVHKTMRHHGIGTFLLRAVQIHMVVTRNKTRLMIRLMPSQRSEEFLRDRGFSQYAKINFGFDGRDEETDRTYAAHLHSEDAESHCSKPNVFNCH